MSVKDMQYVTVEQVLALREEAMRLEAERDALVDKLERVNDLIPTYTTSAEWSEVVSDIKQEVEDCHFLIHLAQRDARVAESAVMDLARHMRKNGYGDEADGVIMWLSQYQRNQAEEGAK